jgi:hypothetical protein
LSSTENLVELALGGSARTKVKVAGDLASATEAVIEVYGEGEGPVRDGFL